MPFRSPVLPEMSAILLSRARFLLLQGMRAKPSNSEAPQFSTGS